MRMIIESETESVQSLWIVYFYLCHILLLFRARRTFRSTRMNFKCMSVAWFLNRFDDMSPRQFYANLRDYRCLSQSSWVQVPVPVLLLFLHGLFAVDFVYYHLRVLCIQSNVIYNIFSFGQFSSFARFDSENVNVFFWILNEDLSFRFIRKMQPISTHFFARLNFNVSREYKKMVFVWFYFYISSRKRFSFKTPFQSDPIQKSNLLQQ